MERIIRIIPALAMLTAQICLLIYIIILLIQN